MQGIHEALNAVGHAAWWHSVRARITSTPPAPLMTVHPRNSAFVAEAEGKARLADVVRVPEGRVASGNGLTAAAQAVGYPVALKMMSDKLAHKTEAGAVAIGIETPRGVGTRVREDVRRCHSL